MAKKQAQKGKASKAAHHSGEYTPGDIQHVALSDSNKMYDHPARMKPDPQGGGYWGDSNGLSTQGSGAGMPPGE